jgi:hypothetical protein
LAVERIHVVADLRDPILGQLVGRYFSSRKRSIQHILPGRHRARDTAPPAIQ